MIVLWEEDYFTKLQCVVEISAFVASHKCISSSVNGNFIFVPLKLPALALALYIYHFLASVTFALIAPLFVQSRWHTVWLTRSIPEGAQAFYIWGVYVILMCFVYVVPAFPLWTFCRRHLNDQRVLLKQLREFSVERSVCFLESERQQLLQSITSGFGSSALFEQYVQEELPKMVLTSGLPAEVALVGSMSHLFQVWTTAMLAYQDGELDLCWNYLLAGFSLSFCTDNIALHLILKMAGTSRADQISDGSTLMKAAGPLASAILMALLNATSAVFINPFAPLWAHAVMASLWLGLTLWLCLRNRRGPLHVHSLTVKEEVSDLPEPAAPPAQI